MLRPVFITVKSAERASPGSRPDRSRFGVVLLLPSESTAMVPKLAVMAPPVFVSEK